jgi:glycosyltransferase involved in cell wall biosynthesis
VLDETFFLRPPIAKRDVPAVLEAATVATSLFAPIPEMASNSANKFFDALAAGRPLLINYGGWHRALLEETGAGIAVEHGDPRAAAARLTALLADEGVLEEARAAARTIARERFDRDTLAVQFAEVLERVGGT